MMFLKKIALTVRKSHDEMDKQMAPFQPQLPRWAIPEDLKAKWNPITTHDANEVSKAVLVILYY